MQVLDLPGYRIDAIERTLDRVEINLRVSAASGICPACHTRSQRVHSTDVRHPRDLPIQCFTVRLFITVRRFVCVATACPKKTFAEQVPDFLPRYAHRTRRFTQKIRAITLATNGQQGARLSKRLGFQTSGRTLLRILHQLPPIIPPAPRIIGIDDWAWRKGRRYGTIICDLERRTVIDLLSDTEVATVSEWLKKHPTVQLVARDRSSSYADAINQGAPQAKQVADRWHLFNNLAQAVEDGLKQYRTCLTLKNAAPVAVTPAFPVGTGKRAQERAANRAARQQRFDEVFSRYQQGQTQPAIAQALGLHLHTVEVYLSTGQFPERQPKPIGTKALQPFIPYIHKRWEEGCQNASQIWREICLQGYDRSKNTVLNYVARLRQGLPTEGKPRTPVRSPIRRYSPKEACRLIFTRPEKQTAQQQHDLQQIRRAHPQLEVLYQFTQRFIQLVRERRVELLPTWIHDAMTSSFTPLQTFAVGLERDRAAVEAGITSLWSNGQTEGHIQRLKLLKRQMYGRAGIDLLRHRLLNSI